LLSGSLLLPHPADGGLEKALGVHRKAEAAAPFPRLLCRHLAGRSLPQSRVGQGERLLDGGAEPVLLRIFRIFQGLALLSVEKGDKLLLGELAVEVHIRTVHHLRRGVTDVVPCKWRRIEVS